MHVFGIDPNKKMEKYARAAAEAAGLLPENFEFVQAVCFFPKGCAVSAPLLEPIVLLNSG